MTRWMLACLVLLGIAACSSVPTKMNPRDIALTEYGVAMRWSEFDQAVAFVDPETRLNRPMTDLERERLKLIQVTGYEVKHREALADGSIVQRVEIRLVSRNTQIERVVTDQETWRWDPVTKRFWLTSGLPDFGAR